MKDGLPYRIARRLKCALNDYKNVPVSMRQIVMVGLGTSGKSNYLPGWLKTLDVSDYDDNWNDWQPDEVEFLRKRIAAGYEPESIQIVFNVPERRMNNILAEMPVTTVAPQVADLEPDEGFTEDDIPDEAMRQYANSRWLEYASDLDLTLPTNRQTVRTLIVTEIQMRRVERRMLQPDVPAKEMATDRSEYKTLVTMYSSAAEDVSQLERQREHREQVQTFSGMIEHAQKVRQTWKETQLRLHMELEESQLIKNMVLLHKVDMRQGYQRPMQRRADPEATQHPVNDARSVAEIIASNQDGEAPTILSDR